MTFDLLARIPLAPGAFPRNLAEGLHIDFETRSVAKLPQTGPWVYTEHYSTGVHCMSYALGEGEVKRWRPGMPCPEEYLYALEQGLPFLAHNAGFERAVTTNIMARRYGWPIPPLTQWVCTAAMAAAMAIPRGLDNAAMVMGVTERKDKEGHALMLRMSRPRSKTKVRCVACGMMSCDCHEMFKVQLTWWDDEARLERLYSIGSRANLPYNASKAAVISMTKSLAVAHAADGIRVNSVCPGYVETDMWTALAREQGALLNQL